MGNGAAEPKYQGEHRPVEQDAEDEDVDHDREKQVETASRVTKSGRWEHLVSSAQVVERGEHPPEQLQ